MLRLSRLHRVGPAHIAPPPVSLLSRAAASFLPALCVHGFASASAPPSSTRTYLLRDFIWDRLYHPREGYFVRKSEVVGQLLRPLGFNEFLDRSEYESAVAANYRRLGVSWLTPVELFQPWYGRALARYFLEQRDPTEPLLIFEVGGGTGTAALTILDHIRDAAPDVYATCRYVSVEVSARLADRQRRRLWDGGHAERFTVEERDASAPWPRARAEPCFVMALEVLDNLPHDRVVRPRGEGGSDGWRETVVVGGERGGPLLREEERPLSDPLIRRCLGAWEEHQAQAEASAGPLQRAKWALRGMADRAAGQPETVFLPTGSLRLLETLHRFAPRHRLLLADFDELPGVQIQGRNAPLVASQVGDGLTRDHTTYLVPRGEADIFFPTDFGFLQRLAAVAAAGTAAAAAAPPPPPGEASAAAAAAPPPPAACGRVLTNREMMGRYADVARARTLSGFNPLLDDFSNTRVFVT